MLFRSLPRGASGPCAGPEHKARRKQLRGNGERDKGSDLSSNLKGGQILEGATRFFSLTSLLSGPPSRAVVLGQGLSCPAGDIPHRLEACVIRTALEGGFSPAAGEQRPVTLLNIRPGTGRSSSPRPNKESSGPEANGAEVKEPHGRSS